MKFQVDFYLPQLLNIYIHCFNETTTPTQQTSSKNANNSGDQQQQQTPIIAELLNTYFRTRCACRSSGIDFSLRCSWLLDAHINDHAKLATQQSKESKRVKRGLNNAIKLYKQIISERLRPQHQQQPQQAKETKSGGQTPAPIITSSVTEEMSPHDELLLAATAADSPPSSGAGSPSKANGHAQDLNTNQ